MQQCYIWTAILLVLINLPVVTTTPIDNGLIGSNVTKECRYKKAIDLTIVLDGSNSLAVDQFERQRQFIRDVIKGLTIGSDATLIALIQYSDEVKLEFSFNEHLDAKSLLEAVDSLRQITGSTRTGEALKQAKTLIESKGRGGSIPPVVLLISDGQSQDDVISPARALVDSGVAVYAVAASQQVNIGQLGDITGDPLRVFPFASKDLIKDVIKRLTKEYCQDIVGHGQPPRISCLNDRIRLEATSRNPFEGSIYVKDHYNVEDCRLDADKFSGHPTELSFIVSFDSCGVRRYRSLNPRGIFVETTIVFQFHPWFLTKVDQAFIVQCFYMEAEKTVHTPLEASMLTTLFATKTVPMPVCRYSLHSESPEGPPVKFASIGQPIFHRWECTQEKETDDLFGMVVHSCYVDDGFGDKVFLLDSKGCGLDKHILGTPVYLPNLRVAVREAHVFKYADRLQMRFQCQISVCLKVDGGCDTLTPPKCNQTLTLTKRDRTVHKRSDTSQTLDVLSETLTVFDVESNNGHTELIPSFRGPKKKKPDNTCLSPMYFGILLSSLVSCLLLIIALTCILQRSSR